MIQQLRLMVLAALYGAIMLGANASFADIEKATAAREETLLKLRFEPPNAPQETAFVDFEGQSLDLADWQGKHLVVNFWATWCAPCKKEMPGLERLNADLGGDLFEVLTIATGRNNPIAMQRFFDEANLETLPLYRDPNFSLANANGVQGLPYSLIIDPNGQIIGRLVGDAEWDSESAYAVIRALIGQSAG